VVALTFAGGGNGAGAAKVLAVLARAGVPGTFFLTGRVVTAYPRLNTQADRALGALVVRARAARLRL